MVAKADAELLSAKRTISWNRCFNCINIRSSCFNSACGTLNLASSSRNSCGKYARRALSFTLENARRALSFSLKYAEWNGAWLEVWQMDVGEVELHY